jgi:hypothetical protein
VCLGVRRVESTPPSVPVYEVVEIQKLEGALDCSGLSTEKIRDSVSIRMFRKDKEGLRDLEFKGPSSIPETRS